MNSLEIESKLHNSSSLHCIYFTLIPTAVWRYRAGENQYMKSSLHYAHVSICHYKIIIRRKYENKKNSVWLKVDCVTVRQSLFTSRLQIYHPHGMLFPKKQSWSTSVLLKQLRTLGWIFLVPFPTTGNRIFRIKVEYWQNQALELVTSKRLYDDYKKDTCSQRFENTFPCDG